MAISGAHVIIYSAGPDADRDFFRTVLQYPHVDAGGGWLIFTLPPAEAAIHPSDSDTRHELYLMCDDLDDTMARLRQAGISFGATEEARACGRRHRCHGPRPRSIPWQRRSATAARTHVVPRSSRSIPEPSRVGSVPIASGPRACHSAGTAGLQVVGATS